MRQKEMSVLEIPKYETEESAVERVPLTEKRLLDINEFQVYVSLGRNLAFSLAREANAEFRWGRRFLIDRVKFDKWCDEQ